VSNIDGDSEGPLLPAVRSRIREELYRDALQVQQQQVPALHAGQHKHPQKALPQRPDL